MDTPICDFVRRYRESGALRFHMPGHKGVPVLGCEPLDITEIPGADALYEASGIIEKSEQNATALFGFGKTLFSTEGSSQCIKAMLFLARLHARLNGNPSNQIIAARNAHKAFIHGCALLDLQPLWLQPESDFVSLCSCPISPETVADTLAALEQPPIAVYLTSPDYLGGMQDIAGVASVCHRAGVPLLVDNAHGAYLRFLEPSQHPVSLGAFLSSDSAHKTLPVLTGGAYLQLSADVPEAVADQAKQAMALFGSTSPSYLILQSLDLCNRVLSDGYPQKLAWFCSALKALKMTLLERGWTVMSSDPLKLVLDTARFGYSGELFSQLLEDRGIICEFADRQAVVLMFTPENTSEELKVLCSVLSEFPRKPSVTEQPPPIVPTGIPVCSVREAVLAAHEQIPVDAAVGRICAAPIVACPPAIPIVVSGERITEAHIQQFHAYRITWVEVIL
ncbi:MAG: amino acid decarboxylase [Oscillospiraceae bacterium]|jgi:arginine decarboxylase